ncbi:MAG: hypothetical protein AB1894_13280 [Chloroflexota bacterium]
MSEISLPLAAQMFLLQDAMRRDLATARRAGLVSILWQERFLTREHLVARLEGLLGRGCFGGSAWRDTFCRDMRVVRQAFQAAGYALAYSRTAGRPGYYLRGQPALGPELAQALAGSLAEIDPVQVSIYRQLPAAERFRQGCSISDAARQVVAYRLQQRNPELSLAEASKLALQNRIHE